MTDVLGTHAIGGEQLVGEIITGFDTAGLTYPDLANRYALSTYGKHHGEQTPRFANKYAYDHSLMLEDLGDDVHPVRHMSYTDAEVVVPIILSQNHAQSAVDERFDEISAAVVRTAALVHDIGECEHPELQEAFGATVGDVNFWDKTADHEKNEAIIRAYLYANVYPELPADLLAAVDGVVGKTVVGFSTDIFEFAEFVGYLETHNRAARVVCELSGTEHEESERFQQLLRLCTDSLLVWYERIGQQTDRFAYAGQVVARSTVTVQNFETIFG